jgi:hypothetical protein
MNAAMMAPEEEMDIMADFNHQGFSEDIDIDLDVGQIDEDIDIADFDETQDLSHFNSDGRDEMMAEGDDASYGMVDADVVSPNDIAITSNDIDLELDDNPESLWQQEAFQQPYDGQDRDNTDYIDVPPGISMTAVDGDSRIDDILPDQPTEASKAPAYDDQIALQAVSRVVEVADEKNSPPQESTPQKHDAADDGLDLEERTPVLSTELKHHSDENTTDYTSEQVIKVAESEQVSRNHGQSPAGLDADDLDGKITRDSFLGDSNMPQAVVPSDDQQKRTALPESEDLLDDSLYDNQANDDTFVDDADDAPFGADGATVPNAHRSTNHPEDVTAAISSENAAGARDVAGEDYSDEYDAYESVPEDNVHIGAATDSEVHREEFDVQEGHEGEVHDEEASGYDGREEEPGEEEVHEENEPPVIEGDTAHGDAQDEGFSAIASRYGLYISYGRTNYRLFAKGDDDDPNEYFLRDRSTLQLPLTGFLSSLREVISEEVSPLDELMIHVDALGLEFSEVSGKEINTSHGRPKTDKNIVIST